MFCIDEFPQLDSVMKPGWNLSKHNVGNFELYGIWWSICSNHSLCAMDLYLRLIKAQITVLALWICICDSSKHKTIEFVGWWMCLNVYICSCNSVMLPTSWDLHENTFNELSQVHADLIRYTKFHFLPPGTWPCEITYRGIGFYKGMENWNCICIWATRD